MHIFSSFGRIVVLAASVLLSACVAGANPGAPVAIARPNPGWGAFLAARYAESIGDSANAARFYMTALKADPQNPQLLQDGFLAGLMAGSPVASRLAPRLPDDALAALLRGNDAAMDGDYAAAEQFYKTLPKDELTSLIQPLLLAWMQYGQGHEQAAQTLLQSFFNSGAFGPVYVLNAALIADAAGDTAKAAQLYGAMQGATPNLRVAQILASWYARQGDEARADAILMALARAHPDLAITLPQLRAQMHQPVVVTPEQGLAEAYLIMAASLSEPRALFLRTVFLRFALELRPDLSPARLILASSMLETNRPNAKPSAVQINNALAVLSPIQPQDPLYATATVQEASLTAQLGKPDAAITLLAPLLADHPDDPGLLAVAGGIRRDAHQCNLAIPYYQKAIALLGSSPPAASWPVFFDRGVCEDALGNWPAAEPDLQQALSLAPDQPYVLNYLAYRWAQQGQRLNQAWQMLLQAAALDPNDPALLDSLGFVALKRGETKQALILLTEAVQLDPSNAVINAHLGDAFHQAGQPLQAIYQWDRALNLGPDASLKAALKQQIEQAIQVMAQ